MPDECLKGVIKDDGGLYCLGWYLYWGIDDKEATLDGVFTADELIAIAQHMKANYKEAT